MRGFFAGVVRKKLGLKLEIGERQWRARLSDRHWQNASIRARACRSAARVAMREPVTEEAAIAAEIARIRSLPSEALRRRWQAVFRRKPPAALSKDLLGRMLVLQNNAELGLELSGLSAGFEAVATASAKFDLSLSLVERRGADGSPAGIEGALEYASDLFDRSSVEAIAGRLVRSTGLVLGRGWILLFVRNKVITRGGSSLLSHYFSERVG